MEDLIGQVTAWLSEVNNLILVGVVLLGLSLAGSVLSALRRLASLAVVVGVVLIAAGAVGLGGSG